MFGEKDGRFKLFGNKCVTGIFLMDKNDTGKLFGHKDVTVHVNGHVSAVLGTDAKLACWVETEEYLTQVTWERRVGSQTETILTHKKDETPFAKDRTMWDMGNGKYDGNIVVRRVTLEDEGTYICSFTTFPSATTEKEIQLEILVEPTITVHLPPVVSQTGPKNVAECTAAAAKPAAQIHWIINGSARASNDTTILHSNGTVTTKSQLWMEPSLRLLGTQAACFISQSNGEFQQERNITLDNILYGHSRTFTDLQFLAISNCVQNVTHLCTTPPTGFGNIFATLIGVIYQRAEILSCTSFKLRQWTIP
ncbi:cell surface glycoprotein CD200 receptor 2-like [Pelodytes ibericus]